MDMIILAKVGFGMKVLSLAWFILALLLILIILVQKGKGGGLSGAFGGAGGAGGLLGTKTGDVLTWFTIGVVTLFLVLTLVMVKFYRPKDSTLGEVPATQTISAPVTEETAEEATAADPVETEDAKTEETTETK